MSKPFIRQDVQAFLTAHTAQGSIDFSRLTAFELRNMIAAMRKNVEPPVIAKTANIAIPTPDGSTIPALLFDPRNDNRPSPLVVFFHGGGGSGDLDSHAHLCADIAIALHLPVIAVEYRLAPEAKWPAAPDDCEIATRWLAANAHTSGREATSLVLCGDSAGDNLAIVVAAKLRNSPAAGSVVAQLLLYPVTDMSRLYPSNHEFGDGLYLTQQSLDWMTEQYGADVHDVRVSPLLGKLANMPSALVVAAGLDPLRDQARAYVSALVAQGVDAAYQEVHSNLHGFATLRNIVPSSERDLQNILSRFKTMLAGLTDDVL
ncbi:TPA: alpha/beta hydrolase [Serratia marcescens]|uniref:alpha/beta hydrolase n=1 Tax=Serratia ureilytica TaxID=300181 RepID=UPI0018D99ABD|nr:alpha/beta hydrolase [Serratia ureilytica]MBH3319155.1 alpha/beta hydrolase [Serratia ureilytica]